jgi:hypothetical protein
MGPRTPAAQKDELSRPRLDEQLKRSHPLIKLSQLMNWKEIERSFGAHFASNRGRPALRPRLVAGLAVSAACQRCLGRSGGSDLAGESLLGAPVKPARRRRRREVHCNEGVAIRIGPKPCGGIREGAAEASAGVRAGQPLSHDMVFVPGADTLQYVEGNILSRVIASDAGTRRGRSAWHARTLLVREPGDLQPDRQAHSGLAARIGKARSRSR